MKFLVVTSRNHRDFASLPDGWLIAGPEPLLQVAPQWEPGTYAVYVLDRAANDNGIELCQVAGIWSERVGDSRHTCGIRPVMGIYDHVRSGAWLRKFVLNW